jgi:RNA 3'-phosphate cyclase
LKAQHLTAIQALKQMCNARVTGCKLGSSEITFAPENIKAGTITIDIGTAGSITLLLQSLIIPALHAPKKVRLNITGGTDVSWSPQIDYFRNIVLPHLRRYTQEITATITKRGYYPKGQGMVQVHITPHKNQPAITATQQGHLIIVKGISHASNDLQQAQVAERQAKTAKLALSQLKVPVDIQATYAETASTGSGITCWAVFSTDKDDISYDQPIILGADILGEKQKKAETVGNECANQLLKEIKSEAPVDSHLADHLIPFLALYGGEIKVAEITEHTKTNIHVCEQFTNTTFKIENNTITANLQPSQD